MADVARTITVTGFGNMSQLESALERAGIVSQDVSKTISGAASEAGAAAAKQAEEMGLAADKQIEAAGKAAAASIESSAKITAAQRAAASAATKAAEAIGLSADEVTAASERAMAAQAKLEEGTVASSSRMAAAYEKLGSTMGSWGVPFSGSVKKMGKDIDDAESKTGKFTASLASLGKVTAFAGIGAVAAAGYEGVKGISALEKQMRMLETQAGATHGQVNKLTSGVLNMAAEVGTKPQELAEGMYHVVSSLNATTPAAQRNSVEMAVLKTAAEGAKVGNANLVDVTNALDAAVISGLPGLGSYSHAMGALNTIVGAGDMTMQNLADALGTGLLAPMKNFGVSLGDIGGALAVFGDSNMRGATAARQLSSAIRIMAAPSKTAATYLAEVGLSSIQLGQDIRSKGLIFALEDLEHHLKESGKTAPEQMRVIANAFGGKQSVGVQIMIAQLDRLRAKVEQVEQGGNTFGAAWKHTEENLSFKTEQLGVETAVLADKFGEFLIPELKTAMADTASVVGWMEKHKTVAEALGLTIGGVLSVAVAVYAEQKLVKLGTATASAVGDLAKFAGAARSAAASVVGSFASEDVAADASSAKITAASTEASAAVEAEAAKMQMSFGEIDSGFATTAAAAETAEGQMAMTFAGIESGVAAEAEAVVAADSEIEAANVAVGASFTAIGAAAVAAAGVVYGAVHGIEKGLEALTGESQKVKTLLGGNQVGEAGKEGEVFAKGHGNFGNASVLGPGITNSTANKYGMDAEEASAKYGIPMNILLADIEQESGGNPLAKSDKGAGGLTQFIPETAAKYGVKYGSSPQDVLSQIMGQAHYLHDLGGNKNIKSALEGYLGEHGPQGEAYANSVLGKAGYKGSDKVVSEVKAKGKGSETRKLAEEAQALTKAAKESTAQLGKETAATKKAEEAKYKKTTAAMGVPAAVATMLSTVQALVGTKYTSGGGHDGWDPIAALKKIGVDCSGLVSQVLHSGGLPLSSPLTTEGLATAKGLSAGAGRYVTVYDRANAGANSHALMDILGKFYESGGNPKYNPHGGVSELSSAQAYGELSSGGFKAYHPTALNTPVAGGQSEAVLLKTSGANITAGINTALEKALKEHEKEIKTLTTRGEKEYKTYESDNQTGNVRTLEKLTGSTTKDRSGKGSQADKEFNKLIAELRATHEKGLVQLASQLVGAHKSALGWLNTELLAAHEKTEAEGLQLQAVEEKDRTKLTEDMANKVVEAMKDAAALMVDGVTNATTALKDAGQSITDTFSATATAIKDATQEMTDAASATVQQISDKSQTEVDTLGERGLYGLNLVAQQQQVSLDQMKTGLDAQISEAQAAIDKAQTSSDSATAATQALVDAVTAQQDVLIGQAQTNLDATKQQENTAVQGAQQNLDNVTAATDAAVQSAQNAVEKASTGTQAEQTAAQSRLLQAQGQQAAEVAQAEAALSSAKSAASTAETNAQNALNSAQANASLAEQEAANALANAQGNASVVLAQAQQTMASVQDKAQIVEAEQKALIEKTKAEAQTQYAGSGLTVNIEGLPSSDAAAIASEVSWVLKTQVPA